MRSVAERSPAGFLARTQGDLARLFDVENYGCNSGICVAAITKGMIGGAATCAPSMSSWFQFDDHRTCIDNFRFFAHRLPRCLVRRHVIPETTIADLVIIFVIDFTVRIHEVVEGGTILSRAQDDIASRTQCDPVPGM